MTYLNIGEVYLNQDKYQDSLNFHNKSLEIQLKILPENHPLIALTYMTVGKLQMMTQRSITHGLGGYLKAMGVISNMK